MQKKIYATYTKKHFILRIFFFCSSMLKVTYLLQGRWKELGLIDVLKFEGASALRFQYNVYVISFIPAISSLTFLMKK